MPSLSTMERVSLKDNREINEKVIQDYIYDNPSILGLGDLTPIMKEKMQPVGGRLDLLLSDESDTRYEVELQLGCTDPSHIMRTIEYWDLERKRYPQFDHCAVIVAEEVTGRFQNVINLFNGAIPIIALQVAGYKMQDESIALIFTKILDRVTPVSDEEEIVEPTDRPYWINRSTPKMLKLMDEIFIELGESKEGYEYKYNKYYVGLARDGVAKNFVAFKPHKAFLTLNIKTYRDKAVEDSLIEKGLDIDYENRWSRYKIKFTTAQEFKENKELFIQLINAAKDRLNAE